MSKIDHEEIEMKQNVSRILLGTAIFCAVFALQISANQSQLLKTSVEGLNATGNAREIFCRLRIHNLNPMTVTVTIPRVSSRFGYQTYAAPGR